MRHPSAGKSIAGHLLEAADVHVTYTPGQYRVGSRHRPGRLVRRPGAVCRRHHLHARLRAGDGIDQRPDVELPHPARGAAERCARLQWPRLCHRERQVRARGRPRQGAESPHGGGREGEGEGRFLIPSTIGEEKATNSFLRAGEPALARSVKMEGAERVAVFQAVREWKNRFSPSAATRDEAVLACEY
jgi:hypothetical protein